MKEKANILFCTDKNYVMPMSVSITSLFENNKDLDICVYIFHSGIDRGQENKLLNLSDDYKQKIKLIYIEEKYFSDVPTLRWSRETYFRLLISEKIIDDIDRLIYLDCDIIINKSIKNILNFYLEGNLLGMFEEKDAPQIDLFNLKDRRYFQAGIIIFDLKKVRDLLVYSKLNDLIYQYKDKIMTVDQDIINICFNGNIKQILKEFNNFEITTYKNNFNRLFNIIDNKEKKDAIVFHYINSKPWHNIFIGSCECVWMKYLKLSPYSYLYKEKYSSIKYNIFRSGLVKVIFFYYLSLSPKLDLFFNKILSKEKYNKLKIIYRKYVK